MLTREQIATRAARELPDGASVSLDPAWANEIKAKLPAGVSIQDAAEGEADVAVIGVESIAADGTFPGQAPTAKSVLAIIAEHQSAEGVSRVIKVGEPQTARAHRLLTNLALFDVTPEGLVMREVAQGVSALDVQLQSDTPLLASDELKVMNV